MDNAIQYYDDVEPKTQGDDDEQDGVLGGDGEQPAWAREVMGGGGGGSNEDRDDES